MFDRNMGESSTCVTQQFSYASGFSNESNKFNPMKAMEESVSFGRFMTETLEWEKWSTFSHNRYVEEAERISKPGSVAQKKAFFEAYYKQLAAQKAAALLVKSDSLKKQEHDEAEVVNTKVDGAESEKGKQDFEGNSMQDQIESVDNDDPHKDHQSEKLLQKDSNIVSEISQSMDKSTDPITSARDNTAAPMNNNLSLRKKSSNAKSLHMSVKFALIRQINKLTGSVMRKFETARISSGSSIASKERETPITTPTKLQESRNELHKHPSFSPLTEKKRNNMQSPIISSSSFNLKTEESQSAASRNKEGGHKNNSKLRQCFCFKPKPPPCREDSKRGTKENSPKLGRKVTSPAVQRKGSSSAERLAAYENTPPNIQD
ncbi:unnamed protein product [Trifolium pratense]|uniref:Uncharacterized protein n=1 Tax=Trifolium pratense TaxID=57577 RepID=A0ACB0LM61_TRIPR|nr:unnamed protein product [Trifolium pratense]